MSKQKIKTVAKNVGANCVRPHFEEMTKKQRGITLIALVITIIVMLILVGVSVTVALNGGLFTTAQKATGDTEIERDKELALSDGRIKVGDTWYDSLEAYEQKIPSANQEDTAGENGGQIVAISPKKETYTVGEEVTIDDEAFYVIADDSEKVTLLAKYNLNTEGTAQVNATRSETTCAFSSTNYWSSETEYPLNLNEYTIPEGVTSVITTAKTYGQAKGGTGRLLTMNEAETLVTDYAGIIYGTSIDATGGSLYFWLASAGSDIHLYAKDGGTFGALEFDIADCGVRPVVEISKSLIS